MAHLNTYKVCKKQTKLVTNHYKDITSMRINVFSNYSVV